MEGQEMPAQEGDYHQRYLQAPLDRLPPHVPTTLEVRGDDRSGSGGVSMDTADCHIS